MLYPLLLQAGGVVNVVGIDIVIDELRSVGGYAVAAVVTIRVHIGVGGLLCPINRDRKAASPCRAFIDVGDDRDGDQGVGWFVSIDHKVRRGAGHRRSFPVAAHEIPVEA